jgi:tetratricopeptide (TPR) repeat protein
VDLLDFEGQDLYFDEALSIQAEQLLDEAAKRYESGDAELPLLQAYFHAPEHLTVLVGLYRFYYYQHRYHDALVVAARAMGVSGDRLSFPPDWRLLSSSDMGLGAIKSMGLLRFYLLTLKAAGYLNLRLDRLEEGQAMLKKVIELDPHDRLGAKALLDVAANANGENAEPKLVIAV